MKKLIITKEQFDLVINSIITESDGKKEFVVDYKGKPYSAHSREEDAKKIIELLNSNAEDVTIVEELEKLNGDGFYSKKISSETITELSPETVNTTAQKMKDKGQNLRSSNLYKTYLNKFIGLDFGDYVIDDITTVGAFYEGDITVVLKPKKEFDTSEYSVVYDIEHDRWGTFLAGDDKLDRRQARIMSLIAMKVNPTTKYKNINDTLEIGGYKY